MRVCIITPAPPKSRYGNRITALRWARILKKLGHRVRVEQEYDGGSYDLLIALHARRSYDSIKQFNSEQASAPIIVALTGTDLYRDLHKSKQAQRSLEIASRIVALQPKALEEIRPNLRSKVRVIYQSVQIDSEQNSKSTSLAMATRSRNRDGFDVCVIGHLRKVKDPFRAAMAARMLPPSSRIRIIQVGGAMSEAMKTRAENEAKKNPRYTWVGEKSRSRAFAILKQSRLCVISSVMEGGANVLSEAIVARVPVLATRIAGTVGILGEDYPGYFEVGDTGELARLLARAESEPKFLKDLQRRLKKFAPLFDPAREESAWRNLLSELYCA
ncbi:MAG TPA: selenoneine biosynthesis selenosugar synthase SenB [Blastocatellia bacterium]|nr:selenoneine biosynthesis selenosugar synthase SenB [Blastocatellia bacterium]